MGINTDLNIDPYFDDFDKNKQFNKVLFAPARAVQARELTQLQTILQDQVERFGSNIYKEGSVISGINVTERSDISFVKLKDTTNFPDPTIYDKSQAETFFVIGETNGLKAEIVKGDNGFETRAPNLKTFYIKYLNTTQAGALDIKEFEQGEVLSIVDENDTPVSDPDGINDMAVTVATVANHVGQSFGVSISEGILFQKGHFVFAEEQFTIVSKYTNVPNDVSIGFTVQENIITSSQDPTLLDNAQGFSNANAPGADRLQLKPILISCLTSEEPEEFFSIIRYENGQAAAIRDVTQFNVIATEMARRTYEESGNYVVRGMNVSVEQDANNSYAVVSAGKAYAFGYEVNNIARKFIELTASTDTQLKQNQSVGVDYGLYYEFVWGTYSGQANNSVIDSFLLDGTRYNLLDGADGVIGTCSIRNVTPGSGSALGKIHVYAIEKASGEEDTAVAKVGSTPVVSTLRGTNHGITTFASGKSNLLTANNLSFSRRFRITVTAGTTFTLNNTVDVTPLTSNIYGVTATSELVSPSVITQNGSSVSLTFGTSVVQIYYDAIDTSVLADDLVEKDIFVDTTLASGKAWIGVPNAVQVISIVTDDGAGVDVTDRFRLVNNQRESYYDISYVQLKSGEAVPANVNLQINVKVLERTTNVGGGFLSVNSYNNVDSTLVSSFGSKNGTVYDLLSAYDFRPYATPWVAYQTLAINAESVTAASISLSTGAVPATAGFITADLTFYLSRVDNVVIDASGSFAVVEGGASENPSASKLPNVFTIGEIFIPGNSLETTGRNALKVTEKITKNYTMEDIGKLDKKIDRLTESVSLSLLESQTRDIFIPDANGLDRFKNGILVDSFKNLQVADIADPEFFSAVDKGLTVSMPKVRQFPIDLKHDNTSNVNTYRDVVTLADTGQVKTLISQGYATNVRNAVSNFYNYSGQAAIDPQFDSGYNTVQNPAINLEIDMATPMLDLVSNIQQLLPLTTTVTQSDTTFETRLSPLNNQFIITRNDTTTQTGLGADATSTTENVGSFVTDIGFNAYMQSREVKILVTGLRPNTRHYIYFDQDDVNSSVYPGEVVTDNDTIDVRDVQQNGTLGSAVRTDASGILAAIFVIPENTYFVGETDIEISDVSTYNSIISGGTSYSRTSYRAYNFTIGQSSLTSTTRTVDFNVNTTVTTNQNVTTRNIPDPDGGGGIGSDPLSQTFFVKSGRAEGASVVYVNQAVVFFQTKSTVNGVTVELREVINGYPSAEVLPFGKKHMTPTEILISADGTTGTVVEFSNPIKLSVEKEYALVIIPDANDPNFLLYTSKVGGTDLATGVSVTQDWGDGVLFTSTNNRAWKSYQDEDLKFIIRRLEFSDQTGYADLVPNDVEFLEISSPVSNFRVGEIAYVIKATEYTGVGVSGTTLTVPLGSVEFNVGDYIILTQGTDTFVTSIVSISSTGGETTIVMAGQSGLDEGGAEPIDASLVVTGIVDYFDSKNPDKIHLSNSSARATASFEATDQIIGYRSGATATIDGIVDEVISYTQPFIYIDNTLRSSTDYVLYDGVSVDRAIPINRNVYLTGEPRTVSSRSNIVTGTSTQDFIIRVNMSNGGYQTTTPVLDSDISMLNAYQYHIGDTEAETSKYLSKEVILQEDMGAVGLKVLLSAYRPPGTVIDVYSRFVNESNIDVKSAWIQLENASPEMYSNNPSTTDYREFEYNLAAETSEFASFQVKIVMRHMTTAEKDAANIVATTNINLFTHLYDYRAIALT